MLSMSPIVYIENIDIVSIKKLISTHHYWEQHDGKYNVQRTRRRKLRANFLGLKSLSCSFAGSWHGDARGV